MGRFPGKGGGAEGPGGLSAANWGIFGGGGAKYFFSGAETPTKFFFFFLLEKGKENHRKKNKDFVFPPNPPTILGKEGKTLKKKKKEFLADGEREVAFHGGPSFKVEKAHFVAGKKGSGEPQKRTAKTSAPPLCRPLKHLMIFGKGMRRSPSQRAL